MRYTLKKSEILRGQIYFQAVLKRGKKIEGGHLRCLMLVNTHHSLSQGADVVFGVIVPRTIRKAVDRNHLKRLIRESFRLNKRLLKTSESEVSVPITLLFSISKKLTDQITTLPYINIDQDMKNILSQVKLGKF